MSALTARLGLYKPAGGELMNVVTDLDNNLDKLDAAIGFVPSTSTTRPTAVFSGMSIRETDTGRLYVSDGSIPASGSWTRQLNIVGTPSLVSLTTDLVIRNRVGTEGNDRLQIRGDGRIAWGSGAAAIDVNIGRTGTASATLTGAFAVTGSVLHDSGRPLPFAEAAGTVSVSVAAAVTGATAVVFPTSRFSVTPIVTIALVDPATGSSKLVPRVTSPTSSGFTATVFTGDGTTTTSTVTLHWHAKQMLSGSAAG